MKRLAPSMVLLCALCTLADAATAAGSKDKEQLRNVWGTVYDKADQPLPGAVVYLKNVKTLAIKSYIADDKGEYRFNALKTNVDYELYAEYNGVRSNTKTISTFDNRAQIQMSLKIDTKR
jgi:protocatechuate 3,4-dioxygenase beta subunit